MNYEVFAVVDDEDEEDRCIFCGGPMDTMGFCFDECDERPANLDTDQEPKMQNQDDQCRGQLEDIDDYGDGLSKWEIDFVANLIDAPPEKFSDEQRRKVQEVWDARVATDS